MILGILIVSLMYLWTLTSGAIRYGLFIEIITGVLIANFLFILLSMDIKIFHLRATIARRVIPSNENRHARSVGIRDGLIAAQHNLDLQSYFVRGLIVLLVFVALAQNMYAYYLGPVKNIVDWSQRPSAQSDPYTYLQNMELIGEDYLPIQYNGNDNLERIITEIDVWIVAPGDVTTGYSALLKTNIPILNLNVARKTPDADEAFLRLVKSLDLRSKDIYMISGRSLSDIKTGLDAYHFNILSVYEIRPTFTYFPLNLIKLELTK